MANPWSTYFAERLNPQLTLVVITGISASAVLVGKQPFLPFPFLACCFTLLYLGALLRLANDQNDYEKDRIAFPDRPLPRGLLTRKAVAKAVRFLQIGLAVYFTLLFILSEGATRGALFLTAGYLWLLFHDFYAKKWMQRHPLINGLAHQGLVLPLTLLMVSLGRPEYAFSSQTFAYALLLFGAFFTFDICRKLDPYAHPISLFYIHYYGFRISYFLVCGFLLLSAVGALAMGVELWLWPCEIAVALLLTVLFRAPRQFQIVELTASLSLMAHTWAGALQWT